MDILAWLDSIGMQRYAAAFDRNDVDAGVLAGLTDADLEKLGVASLGHRKKILAAIAVLQSDESAAAVDVDPVQPGSRAERRRVTVLFADLVGSTEIASRFDPEEVRELVRTYQAAVAREISRFGGSIAQYLGDGVMAYFSWPKAYEDAADRAMHAGLSLVQVVSQLQGPNGAPLAARVGIASGLAVVGDTIGEGPFTESAVVGEAPNLAARLQALAEPGGVVVESGVRRSARARFHYIDLGEQKLKGFGTPLSVLRLVGADPRSSRVWGSDPAAVAPLVGRDSETSTLLRCWSEARSGNGSAVLISGEAGIGKSRLIQDFVAAISPELVDVHRFQCSSYFVDTPLYPVTEHLREVAQFRRQDSDHARMARLRSAFVPREDGGLLVGLMSDILAIQPGSEGLPPTPQQKREKLMEGIIDGLCERSEHAPGIIIFEDVHWSDPATLEFLTRLIDRSKGRQILVLATTRPERPLPKESSCVRIELQRLDPAEARRIVRGSGGGEALAAPLIDRIVGRADGVPLFVEELARMIIESRSDADSDEAQPAGQNEQIPETLQDLLVARIDRLPTAKSIAQVAAVVGREFGEELLSEVAGLPHDRLEPALAELVEGGMIVRRGDASAPAVYAFKHTLVQDAAYSTLLRGRRRQLHGDAANAILRLSPALADSEPEMLAHHFMESDFPAKAIPFLDSAAQKSIERSGSVEAVAHLRRALKLLEGVEPSPERDQTELRLVTKLGAQLAVTKGYGASEVEAAFGRAWELGRGSGDARGLPPVLFGLWRYYLARCRYEESREIAQKCLALGRSAGEVGVLVESHHALSWTLMAIGEIASARDCVENALRLYDPSVHKPLAFVYGTDPGPHSRALLAWQLCLSGRPDGALEANDRALSEAEAGGHRVTLGICQFYASVLHQLRREPEKVLSFAEAAVATCREQGVGFYLALSTIMHGWSRTQLGDTQAAEDVRRGLDGFLKTGALVLASYFRARLADALEAAGRTNEALISIGEAIALAEQNSEYCFYPDLLRQKAALALRLGACDDTEAEAILVQSIAWADRCDTPLFKLRSSSALARLQKVQGRGREAHDTIAAALAPFQEGFLTQDLREGKALRDSCAPTDPAAGGI